MVRFQLISLSSCAENKLQMWSVTQHQFRCRQTCGNFSQIHLVHDHSLFVITKNDLSWLNNLFMLSIQLFGMPTYAKNKLQMCSITQHQCRRRQMWGKFSQIHIELSLFISYKKWLVLTEQSIHGKVSTH